MADSPDDLLQFLRAAGFYPDPEHARDLQQRGPERRRGDRRVNQASRPRRQEDADRNVAVRAFISRYLNRLSVMKLRLWVDGLWLGTATDDQLRMLVDAITADERAEKQGQKDQRK